MRVLEVMECTIGGTRRHLRDVVLGMRARGVEVDVVCAAEREPKMRADMERFAAAGASVHEIPMVRRISPATDFRHALRMLPRILDRRLDVVHTHSSKAGALGRGVATCISGAARVHTPHTFAAAFDGKGQGGEEIGNKSLVIRTEQLLGRVTDAMIHVSADELEQGQTFGVIARPRAHVVHNGIDPAPFEAPGDDEARAFRTQLGIPLGAPLVGTVGLLNDAKGHDLLLEAVAGMADDVHVLIVGHGELESTLRAQAETLGLAARLHMPGWLDDVAAGYRALDVFALPSRWEGLSYALLEAMAAGRACVSTDVNGSREALVAELDDCGAAGAIVPCGEVDALAEQLTRLLGDESTRAAMGTAARERVHRAFTVDRMVERTLDVFATAGAVHEETA